MQTLMILLAEVIDVVHLAYVAFVVVGLLLILIGIPLRWRWIRNPWFRCIHLMMILIVAFEAMGGMECPLTTWEMQLRWAAGQEVRSESYVGRLMQTIFFLEPNRYTWLLTTLYYGFAGAILATFIFAPPRFRRRSDACGLADSPANSQAAARP